MNQLCNGDFYSQKNRSLQIGSKQDAIIIKMLNYCPSINGPFCPDRRSPRVSGCGV